MAIYSLSELCHKTGIKKSSIRVYQKRGKVVLKNDTFDDLHPTNMLFLQKYNPRNNDVFVKEQVGAIKPEPETKPEIVEVKKSEPKPEKKRKIRSYEPEIEQEETADDISDYDNFASLSIQKQKLEIKNLKNKDKLDRLKIMKQEGQLIPVDIARDVFLWASESIIKTYEKDIENMIGICIKTIGGEQSQYGDIRRKLMSRLELTGNDAKEYILQGLKNAVNDYKEVRGRGEGK